MTEHEQTLTAEQIVPFAEGGYPTYYMDGDNSVLCANCARDSVDHDNPRFRPVTPDINYEDDSLYCDNCSAHIPPAYGDDA